MNWKEKKMRRARSRRQVHAFRRAHHPGYASIGRITRMDIKDFMEAVQRVFVTTALMPKNTYDMVQKRMERRRRGA